MIAISSEGGKASILNSFFCSVFTKEKTEDLPTCDDQSQGNVLSSVIITNISLTLKFKLCNHY